MGRSISKKSRKKTSKSLEKLEKILEEYPECPDCGLLGEKEIKSLQLSLQQLGECVKEIGFKGFSNFDKIKRWRNISAHSTEELSIEENNQFFSEFFGILPTLRIELEANLNRAFSQNKEIRQHEKFGSPQIGNNLQRKQLVDAIDDSLDRKLKKDDRVSFPETIYSKQAEKILQPETPEQKKLFEYAQRREGVKTSIVTDTLKWLEETRARLSDENPFKCEESFIQSILELENCATNYSNQIRKMREKYNDLPSINSETRGDKLPIPVPVDFDFYVKKLDELKSHHPRAQQQNLLNQAENELIRINKELENNDLTKDEGGILLSTKQATENAIKSIKLNIKCLEEDETQFGENNNKINDEVKSLLRNLKSDTEKSCNDRRNIWETDQINSKRDMFVKGLYNKISRFQRLEKLLSPFINELGTLWNLSDMPFQDNGFEILKQYADILENNEFLMKLAELIAKHNREQVRYEKGLREKIEIVNEYKPRPAYRGEISGLKLSNKISSVIPSEISLYKNAKTQKYFMLKFAQKQLLSYSYERDILHNHSGDIDQDKAEVKKLSNKPKGPVLICVDTGGSMLGNPVRIAKTITFALAKITLMDKRGCYLISFLNGIKIIDMKDFKNGNSLSKLVKFLRMTFGGKKKFSFIFEYAINVLCNNNLTDSDVLVVSDSTAGKLSEELKQKVVVEQEKNTCFYSLTIGKGGNTQSLDNFDANWNYDPKDKNAQRKLVRQLDVLRKRKLDKVATVSNS